MAKKKASKIPAKKDVFSDDGSPIIIQGGLPIDRFTSSILVNLTPSASEPHHLPSPRQCHRVCAISIDGCYVKVHDDDWSICVYPQMLMAFSESGRMTAQVVSRRGFEESDQQSRDKDRSPFDRVEVQINGLPDPITNYNREFKVEIVFEKIPHQECGDPAAK